MVAGVVAVVVVVSTTGTGKDKGDKIAVCDETFEQFARDKDKAPEQDREDSIYSSGNISVQI